MAIPVERLLRDLDSPEIRHGVDQGFWQIERREDLRVYVRVFAPDEQVYLVEFDCNGYGDEPIAGRFVDPENHRCLAAAWHQGDGVFTQWVKYDPAHLFLCWDQDRLGIEHHPDWRSRRAWAKSGNPIYAYLEFLRKLLHVPSNGYSRKA